MATYKQQVTAKKKQLRKAVSMANGSSNADATKKYLDKAKELEKEIKKLQAEEKKMNALKATAKKIKV